MDISSISTNYTVANADKSAEQSNSLQSSLKNISSDSSEEQLKGVIKDFESYFVEQVIKQMKEAVTKAIGCPIWQKSFHDHVIRTQTDYEIIWLYIDSNPQTWQTDCLNPNRNQPQQSDTRKDVTL